MATTQTTDAPEVPPPAHFAERADQGDETWVEDWITAYLGLTLGDKQRAICRSVAANERTAVIGANGTGKTYVTGAIVLAWQNVRYPAISFGTSGTGKKLYRTLCRPIDKLHGAALDGVGLPGTFKEQPPRIDYDDPEHYFEAATPTDAGELEGAHEEFTLAIIEEADKDDVDHETIDAMRSLIPDYEKGRLLAVGNPPTDETDVFAEITAASSPWETIRVSSFDSWNVLVETGERDGDRIEGMATVSKLRGDWEDYHDEPWPGVEQARAWSDPDAAAFREDLDERWYRRRAGVIPPGDAGVHRPFYPDDVRAALERDPLETRPEPVAVGIDLARKGGDETVVSVLHPDRVERRCWDHTDHPANEAKIKRIIDGLGATPEIAVDATGEGSGVADALRDAYGAVRFKSSENAVEDDEYDNKWTESLAALARRLETLALPDERESREAYFTAARVVEYTERELRSGNRLEATSKSDIKDRLGYSPDRLDADAMAAWAAEYGDRVGRSETPSYAGSVTDLMG